MQGLPSRRLVRFVTVSWLVSPVGCLLKSSFTRVHLNNYPSSAGYDPHKFMHQLSIRQRRSFMPHQVHLDEEIAAKFAKWASSWLKREAVNARVARLVMDVQPGPAFRPPVCQAFSRVRKGGKTASDAQLARMPLIMRLLHADHVAWE